MSARLSTGLPSRLLGTHVGRGAEDHPRLRHRRRRDGRRLRHIRATRADRLHRLRQAEVQHLHRAVGAHLDVGGLEIAVDDPLLVRRLERLGDLLRDRAAPRRSGSARARSAATRSSPSTSSITSARGCRPPPRGRRCARCSDGSARPASSLRARSGRAARDRWRMTSGRILIATSRSSFVSRARYTSPMPPAPRAERIS